MKTSLENIVKNTRVVIGAMHASIIIGEGKQMQLYAKDEDLEYANKTKDDDGKSRKKSLLKLLVNEGNPLDLSEYLQENDRKKIIEEVMSAKKSFLGERQMVVPILSNSSQILGAVLMEAKREDQNFNPEDLMQLESYSLFLSLALERASGECNISSTSS
jgi:hypothetical protein